FSVYGLKSAGATLSGSAGRVATAAEPRTIVAHSSGRSMRGPVLTKRGGGMGRGRAVVGPGAMLTVAGLSDPGQNRVARGAEPALARFEFAENHMGTRFRIVLYAADQAAAERASAAAFRRVADLNGIMSDYLPESELMRLCKRAGGPAVLVGP